MNKNPAIVSIVIPVYNGGNFLRQAIESAVTQTYPAVEIIVVNDGSNDNGVSETIALGYKSRVRYLRKANGGVSSALNYGIGHMTGEWFAWLSHDDMFTSDRIANDMRTAEIYPEARVIFCGMKIISHDERNIRTVNYPLRSVTNPREALALGGVNLCAMTIHHECFEKTGGFNEQNLTTQDVEMSLRLASFYPYYPNPEIGLLAREHPNRGTYKLTSQNRTDSLILSRVIHDELGISAFFPEFSKLPGKPADAWIWMGSQYLSFGSPNFAREAFDNALSACKSTSTRFILRIRIAAIWLAKTLIKKEIRFALKNMRDMLLKGYLYD